MRQGFMSCVDRSVYCLCLLVTITGGDGPDNKGKQFILVFMENMGTNFDLQIFVTTSRPYEVEVNVTSPKFSGSNSVDFKFTIKAGDIEQLLFSNDLRMYGSSRSTKAILVSSSDEVVAYGINVETYSNDGFLCLPVSVLGTEHYAMSIRPQTGGRYSELALAAVHDGTDISLTFPANQGVSVSFDGSTYTGGTTLSVNLDQYDTLQVQTTGDLTGTYVNSTKAISVFSGATKVRIGSGGSSDHIVEQIPPVHTWGKSFVTAPIPDRTIGDIFRFIASEDGTFVNITGMQSFTIPKAGQYVEKIIASSTYTKVESSSAILIGQFVQSQTSTLEPADPAMMIVPPIQQFAADYTFTTPKYSVAGSSYTNQFSVVIDKDQRSGLLLDEVPVDLLHWTDIAGTSPVISGRTFNVGEGKHRVRHRDTHIIFAGFLYGFAKWESYFFCAGMRLSPVNEPCYASTTVFGDGLDNDCDGKIDEEGCTGVYNGTDDDLDGNVDEDCAIPPPVNGNWSDWSSWTCDVSCGGGHGTRARTCTDPPPLYDGFACTGDSTESRICNTNNCPIDGVWTGWSTWSNCSELCGPGSETRNRTCTSPQNGGQYCEGNATETNHCKLTNCPIPGAWSSWSNWTACSLTCGQGWQSRARTCTDPIPQYGGANCTGNLTEERTCSRGGCPVDGSWTGWSAWSNCSELCGPGNETRNRTCTPPIHGGQYCVGNATETNNCKLTDCPIDGGWTSWTNWTQCSQSCGEGTSQRNRSCTNPPPQNGGANCSGNTGTTESCLVKECFINGNWSVWTDWSACSVSCGSGTGIRSRLCDNPPPQYNGTNCQGLDSENQTCQMDPCPVDGNWTVWAEWSSCSQACVEFRNRSCTDPEPQHSGNDCDGLGSQTLVCFREECEDLVWMDPTIIIILATLLGVPVIALTYVGLTTWFSNKNAIEVEQYM